MANIFEVRDKDTGEVMTATDEMNAVMIYLRLFQMKIKKYLMHLHQKKINFQ